MDTAPRAMPDIKLGSLFDGIGVFPLAASRCGIRPVWASEIEKAPISITKRHFPDMAHLGGYYEGGRRENPAGPCDNLRLSLSELSRKNKNPEV